jgi:hypothetical protein
VHNLGGNIPYEIERMDHRCLLDTPEEKLPSSRFRRSKVYVDCNSFGPPRDRGRGMLVRRAGIAGTSLIRYHEMTHNGGARDDGGTNRQ